MKTDQKLPGYNVSYHVKINSSADKVWEVIATPGNLNFCHPCCVINTILNWGDVGAEAEDRS